MSDRPPQDFFRNVPPEALDPPPGRPPPPPPPPPVVPEVEEREAERTEEIVEAPNSGESREETKKAPIDKKEVRGLEKQIVLFGGAVEDKDRGEYVGIAGSPVYVPRGKRPHVQLLCNTAKRGALLRKIEGASEVSEHEKDFLRIAATRHVVFDYGEIAEYYAHAAPDMQRLMEESALVIPDIENAIENGYVQLGATIRRLYAEVEASEASDEE